MQTTNYNKISHFGYLPCSVRQIFNCHMPHLSCILFLHIWRYQCHDHPLRNTSGHITPTHSRTHTCTHTVYILCIPRCFSTQSLSAVHWHGYRCIAVRDKTELCGMGLLAKCLWQVYIYPRISDQKYGISLSRSCWFT